MTRSQMQFQHRTIIPGLALAAALGVATATATAGDPAHALVTIETVEGVPGTSVDVGVTIEVDDLIGSFSFDAYADDLLVSDILYDGPLFSNGWEGWDTTPSMTPNISAACIFPEDQVTGFQQLFSMQVEVPEDAEIGSFVDVDFTQSQVTNYSFQIFEITVVAGGIDVVPEIDPCPADVANGDGVVDLADLLMLLDAWGQTDSPADLNEDGIVNIFDLLMLLDAWGPCS
jgi:hypothetical protein